MNGSGQPFVMLFSGLRQREILLEEVVMEAPGFFCDGVGVAVFFGEEGLVGTKLRLVVLMCFDLSCHDRKMSSGLHDLLVGAPDVSIFSEDPWPAVEVDCLAVKSISGGNRGSVVNSNTDGVKCEGGEHGASDFRSSR